MRACYALQCGLDTSKKMVTPIDEQMGIFKSQLELGKELNRPISVSQAAFLPHMLSN